MAYSVSFKKIISIIFLLIVTGAVLFLVYSGLFSRIVISEKEIGPYQVVYKSHVGPYQEVGPIMDEIYNSLKNDEQIETSMGFGIYYDDPKKTHVEDLRSDIGSILDEKDYAKIPKLKKRFKIKKYLQKKCVVVEFPFRNKFSIFIGVMRVYPQLTSYIKEKKYKEGPIMEIYDMPNKKIIYAAPIN